MTKYPKLDYQQRPASYWDDQDVLTAVLRDVKGSLRRKLIADYWHQGRLTELHEELLKDTLSETARVRLGRIHPAFMGGEYLPDYRATEVEIARLELESTTADVISLRAVRDPRGIRYRIVDEYETDFELPFETSRHPLTLRRLIQFIDGSREPNLEGSLALAYNEMNAQSCPRAELRHFTTISSHFYPQLYEHFEHEFVQWVEGDQPSVRDGRAS